MIHLPITSYFAALLTFMFITLSVKVIGLRRRNLVPIGDGGNKTLQYAMRAQGNFMEYGIWYIMLSALCEIQQLYSSWFLMLLGSCFTLARLSHACSLLQREQQSGELDVTYRKIGMIGSFGCLLVLATRLFF